MKNVGLIVQIVFALVGIFALGIWVGRTTAPEPSEFGQFEVGSEVDGDEGEDKRADRSPADRVSVSVVKRYKKLLGLSKEQLEELRPIFTATGKKMLKHPVRSEERANILREFHEEIRPVLTEQQQTKLDATPMSVIQR